MNRSKSVGVALASVLIGGALLAIGGFALANVTPHQAALQCVKSTTQADTCSINLSTFPDSLEGVHGANGGPHPDWVTYSNDNIDVPANTTIDVTIDQYDTGGSLNNPFFDHVWGTHATLNGKPFSSINPNVVGHTFTLRNIPGNGPYLFISVPLEQNLRALTEHIGIGEYPKPNVIKFSFKTGSAATYEWNCEFPCGGTREGEGFGEAMGTFGYMSGTLTVE